MGTGRAQDDILRSALAGVSTGGRTFTALAALAGTASPDAAGGPDPMLVLPWVRGLIGLLAAGELLADKLPMAPSRLELPGLSGRVVVGAVCGAVIARRDADLGTPSGPATITGSDPIAAPGDVQVARSSALCMIVGAVSAAAGAWAGTRWRSAASSMFGSDRVGAVLEDAAVLGLAAAAR